MRTALRLASLALVGLVGVLTLLPGALVRPTAAAGFGATCLNRHDAALKNVLVYGNLVNVNYTGNGDIINVQAYYGYWVDVYLTINPAIMMNAQADTTNGSVFVHTTVFGAVLNLCAYNIGLNQTSLVVEAHPCNMTGQQVVTWGTGTSSGQYNLVWTSDSVVG
jgi:hypothetical protein